MEEVEHLDVLIVGAGLSRIAAACHLQRRCPEHRYAILEGREALGGTWDLFRYPGVRSDSDMYTLGYAFRPWRDKHAIADGAAILGYLRDTAREHGVERHIRYGHRVVAASWSTPQARWTVEVAVRGVTRRLSCDFLFMCSGYYRYEAGHRPDFAGLDDYRGRVVHPQQWPAELDWTGLRVVVIGSGATAMTLVPALAERAAKVTLLQRSPTWVLALPAVDPLAERLRGRLPARWVFSIMRWKAVLVGQGFFQLCRRQPERASRMLLSGVRRALGPLADRLADFTPRYKPWTQRLCLLPDGDLFRALRAGRAEVVTDEIERFTAGGLKLRSGRELDADLVVTATGLELQVLGGVAIEVDGRRVDPADTLIYKGLMHSGVPNLASCTGYTNASWTLKAELSCEYVGRLLQHMRRRGLRRCVPQPDGAVEPRPWIDFGSGYVQRALDRLPRQGSRPPWTLHQNYLRDLLLLRFGRLDDGVLRFD